MPVAITDWTGLITAATTELPLGADGVVGEGVANLDDRLDIVAVRWLGGACDERVDISFARSDAVGFRLRLRTIEPAGCILIGIQRGVALRFAIPMPADLVQVEGVPGA